MKDVPEIRHDKFLISSNSGNGLLLLKPKTRNCFTDKIFLFILLLCLMICLDQFETIVN